MEARAVIAQWETGEQFGIAVDELQVVESALRQRYLPITHLYSPSMTEEFERNWQHSARLVDVLRGKNTHISLQQLTVEPIREPYETLVAASIATKLPEKDFCAANTLGFYVTALMTSSAKLEAGQLRKPVWLMRKPKQSAISTRKGWTRYVGLNEGDSLDDLYKTSQQRAASMRGIGYGIRGGTRTTRHKRGPSL
ncbi:MAG TPA: hypothetical protein VG992_03625 [Candidatus Saccharimonadales bacterium]|nr:hypothetical protein [Candidatus Saccharimonadales bacterium]